MSADVRIRAAGAADAAATRRLLVETWHHTYDALLGPERVTATTDAWHAVEALARQIERADASFLLADHDGTLVGHAYAHPGTPQILSLGRLYVHPAWQRRGIGRALLAAVLDRHPNARLVRLTVREGNAAALAFYRRHGFTVVEPSDDGGLRLERPLAGACRGDAGGPGCR